VLEVTPYGEGDALVTLLTAAGGAWRGLAKGGGSRSKASLWQPGNLVAARWAARLPDQLGFFTAELVHPGAALAMPDRLALAVLNAACAVAAGAVPERQAHPASFHGLARLLAGIAIEGAALPAMIAWELDLLRELGFGLDFGANPVTTGENAPLANDRLAYVSPRTGRAVSLSAAGDWASRLLPLPPFLLDGADPDLAECRDGLALTGHFLARDAFGGRNRPLPPARTRLYELVADRLAEPPHAR
jgi:DNA repair protein RecO (recombination protein O)